METAVMRTRRLPVPIAEQPTLEDRLEADPGTNPGFDVSSNFFFNKKIELLKWALTKCRKLIEIDILADIAKRQGVSHQVRPSLVRANDRILTGYSKRRFSDGSVTMPAYDPRVIRYCEKNDWQLVE